MADFHGYTVTITAKVTVPANADGSAATFSLATLPAGVAQLLQRQFGAGAGVGLPVASADSATPVTVA